MIDAVSELDYKVAKLKDIGVEDIHGSRLRPYKPSFEGTTVSKDLMNIAELTEALCEHIEKVTDIDEDNGGIHLQVQWLGLPDEHD